MSHRVNIFIAIHVFLFTTLYGMNQQEHLNILIVNNNTEAPRCLTLINIPPGTTIESLKKQIIHHIHISPQLMTLFKAHIRSENDKLVFVQDEILMEDRTIGYYKLLGKLRCLCKLWGIPSE
jgi:hypothetical protein